MSQGPALSQWRAPRTPCAVLLRACVRWLGRGALLLIAACSSDLNVGSNVAGASSRNCEGQPCGTSCGACAASAGGCKPSEPAHFCDGSGSCVQANELRCSGGSPCEGKYCGQACSFCAKGDPNCVEPNWNPVCRPGHSESHDRECELWPKSCDAFGRCVPDHADLCDDDPPYACYERECGERCCLTYECDGLPFACDADGVCVLESWAFCR